MYKRLKRIKFAGSSPKTQKQNDFICFTCLSGKGSNTFEMGEKDMEKECNKKDGTGKICPVCGDTVAGRSDKIYCCDECRTYAHNQRLKTEREKIPKEGPLWETNRNLQILAKGNKWVYIKIIYLLSHFFKIMYKFGHPNKFI